MKVENDPIQADYRNRISKVFAYIDQNLKSDLSLEKVSEVACFSPFHFHRVFKTITEETLNEYVTRRRIEKSALDLLHTTSSILQIAITYGFNDNSTYTRSFKNYYGIGPKEFRKQNPNRFSKIRQLQRKNGQVYPDHEKYICVIEELKNWIQMNTEFKVKEIPELHLATVTHIGVNGIEGAFDRLLKWANSKHLLQNPEAKVGRIFYDSFKVTEPDKVRMSPFLVTHEPFDVEGDINRATIDAGKCIVGRFEVTPNDFEKAWSGMFIWMNEQGYKKSLENPFEIYHNDFRDHPENKFIVDLHVPIE